MRQLKPGGSARAGFSMVEVVIVLFLTGVMLFAVSGLISRTLETLKFLQEKSQTLESATLGCERLSSELREAVSVTTPIPIGKVSFVKVKPQAPLAVGNDMAADPVGWTRSYSGGQLARVTYDVDAESRLLRTVDSVSHLVATDVNAFVVTPAAGAGSYLVSLSLQEKRRVIVFETIVTCPALQKGFGAP